ncbi:MAG: hypothetical protein PVG14_17865, partial [Anaerolineales bacterium]
MTVHVERTSQYIHNLRNRIPFRYGIAEMTAVPHLFLKVECEIDGESVYGVAADSLIPKWFTKDPKTSYREDVGDMLQVIERACQLAQGLGKVETVFGGWQQIYAEQQSWASKQGYPPLLWNFGVSLVERAVIDAFCRAKGLSFNQALRRNAFGMRLGELHSELHGKAPRDLLPNQPLRKIHVRHTIGLGDPLSESEISAEERIDDGLPHSLEASIRTYGLSYFKVKVSGNLAQDAERLCQIDGVLQACDVSHYYFTLDGNEQYESVKQLRVFWEGLRRDSACAPHLNRLLFVEQPLHRAVALNAETQTELQAWKEKPLMIIDESDALIESLRTALDSGYAGTSHKNCKGVFKGIANACLLAQRRANDPHGDYVLSGEDLANIGPVALLQDLAVMASLGIEHVERNGHHYFAGLSMFPAELQQQVIQRHADLYRSQD